MTATPTATPALLKWMLTNNAAAEQGLHNNSRRQPPAAAQNRLHNRLHNKTASLSELTTLQIALQARIREANKRLMRLQRKDKQ